MHKVKKKTKKKKKIFFDLCGNRPCLYSVSVIYEFQWGKGWIDNHPKNVIH